MGNVRNLRTSSCERMRAAAALEVDGALSQLELAVLDAHVARCAECHTFRREIAELTAALREAPAEPFRAHLILPYRRRYRTVVTRVAAVAATVAVGLVSLSTATDVERSTSPERQATTSGAYYQSIDYELYLMRAMIDRQQGTRVRVAI
jgi:predicted anti-sigma-YlaC factor YlaD